MPIALTLNSHRYVERRIRTATKIPVGRTHRTCVQMIIFRTIHLIYISGPGFSHHTATQKHRESECQNGTSRDTTITRCALSPLSHNTPRFRLYLNPGLQLWFPKRMSCTRPYWRQGLGPDYSATRATVAIAMRGTINTIDRTSVYDDVEGRLPGSDARSQRGGCCDNGMDVSCHM